MAENDWELSRDDRDTIERWVSEIYGPRDLDDRWWLLRREAIGFFADHDPIGFLLQVLKAISPSPLRPDIQGLGLLSPPTLKAMAARLRGDVDRSLAASNEPDATVSAEPEDAETATALDEVERLLHGGPEDGRKRDATS